jgi:hypothetical protein
MTNGSRQNQALQTIFSFFLGLMVLAFVGVGVNTFYPSPAENDLQQRQEISRQRDALSRRAAPGTFTAAEQAELDSLAGEEIALNEKQRLELREWSKVTSIVLVLFATVVLVVSLIRSEQLRVISNGLLLGGLFTMIYGVGLVVFSGNSLARFVVIFFSLLVAIGLGYLRFVRDRRTAATVTPGAPAMHEGEVRALTARVAALEERAAAAAVALSGGSLDQNERPSTRDHASSRTQDSD